MACPPSIPNDVHCWIKGNHFDISQFVIMAALWDMPLPIEGLLKYSKAMVDVWQLERPVTGRLRHALSQMIEQGFITILNNPAIETAKEKCRVEGVIGPLEHLEIGLCEFTEFGGKYALDLYIEALHWDVFSDWVVSRDMGNRSVELYATTESAALQYIKDLDIPKMAKSISSPENIGPWCDRWWRVFPSGVRVLVRGITRDLIDNAP